MCSNNSLKTTLTTGCIIGYLIDSFTSSVLRNKNPNQGSGQIAPPLLAEYKEEEEELVPSVRPPSLRRWRENKKLITDGQAAAEGNVRRGTVTV